MLSVRRVRETFIHDLMRTLTTSNFAIFMANNMGLSDFALQYNMKLTTLAVFFIILGFTILIGYIALLFNSDHLNLGGEFSLITAKDMSPFVSAFVGIFFSLAGTILLFVNLKLQTNVHSTNQLLVQKNQFEGTFFNMLNLHNEIVKNIDSIVEDPDGGEDVEIQGKGFFDEFTNLFVTKCEDRKVDSLDELTKLYEYYYTVHNSDIGHYFRNLYHIVNYVDKNPYFDIIRGSEGLLKREDYIKILRAQLSNSEIACLALNGLSTRGKDFRPLIEKYRLLKNINFELELQMDKDYYSNVPKPEILALEYEHLTEIYEEQKRAINGVGGRMS